MVTVGSHHVAFGPGFEGVAMQGLHKGYRHGEIQECPAGSNQLLGCAGAVLSVQGRAEGCSNARLPDGGYYSTPRHNLAELGSTGVFPVGQDGAGEASHTEHTKI